MLTMEQLKTELDKRRATSKKIKDSYDLNTI